MTLVTVIIERSSTSYNSMAAVADGVHRNCLYVRRRRRVRSVPLCFLYISLLFAGITTAPILLGMTRSAIELSCSRMIRKAERTRLLVNVSFYGQIM